MEYQVLWQESGEYAVCRVWFDSDIRYEELARFSSFDEAESYRQSL
jgi:hypothetical protein